MVYKSLRLTIATWLIGLMSHAAEAAPRNGGRTAHSLSCAGLTTSTIITVINAKNLGIYWKEPPLDYDPNQEFAEKGDGKVAAHEFNGCKASCDDICMNVGTEDDCDADGFPEIKSEAAFANASQSLQSSTATSSLKNCGNSFKNLRLYAFNDNG